MTGGAIFEQRSGAIKKKRDLNIPESVDLCGADEISASAVYQSELRLCVAERFGVMAAKVLQGVRVLTSETKKTRSRLQGTTHSEYQDVYRWKSKCISVVNGRVASRPRRSRYRDVRSSKLGRSSALRKKKLEQIRPWFYFWKVWVRFRFLLFRLDRTDQNREGSLWVWAWMIPEFFKKIQIWFWFELLNAFLFRQPLFKISGDNLKIPKCITPCFSAIMFSTMVEIVLTILSAEKICFAFRYRLVYLLGCRRVARRAAPRFSQGRSHLGCIIFLLPERTNSTWARTWYGAGRENTSQCVLLCFICRRLGVQHSRSFW